MAFSGEVNGLNPNERPIANCHLSTRTVVGIWISSRREHFHTWPPPPPQPNYNATRPLGKLLMRELFLTVFVKIWKSPLRLSFPCLYSVWKSIKHTLPKNGIAPIRLSNILIPKFTSRWSPSASPNILSMFLMTATFCCAVRGWVIWLGVGPAWNKRISIQFYEQNTR